MGWCCPIGSTKYECQESEKYTCSLGAVDPLAKYAYCPRKTSTCSTPGRELRALINLNQTVSSINMMTQSDVCSWELKIDGKFIQKWLVNVTLDKIYFNLTFLSTDNLTVYVL